MGDERTAELEARLEAEGLGLWFDNEPRAAEHFPDWLVVGIPSGAASPRAGSTDLFAHGDTKQEALERLAALVFGDASPP
jgi:hypothetical protein